jgi:heme A synthase
MFCVFAGFGIAVHVFSDHNEKHFVEFQHRKMGLVVFLLAVLQLVGGIVRPGLPQPNTSDATTSFPDNIDTVGKEETPPMPPTKKSLFRSIWEYTHRALGIGSLALAWWTCDSGLQLYNQEFGGEEYTAAFWGVTGGLAGVIAILTVFAKFGGSK